MVIGHEITHAFDDQGRQYDAEGSLQGKARPEWRRMQIQVDPHSPPRFRVLGPASLMPEFYTAFRRPVPEWVTDRQKEAIW